LPLSRTNPATFLFAAFQVCGSLNDCRVAWRTGRPGYSHLDSGDGSLQFFFELFPRFTFHGREDFLPVEPPPQADLSFLFLLGAPRFACVQENIIRGGQRDRSRRRPDGSRMPKSRSIKGIDEDMKLNKALWEMAEVLRNRGAQ
jgi:hypothetical protein